MNAGELPMILFTVLAQMCVGAFVTLGLIQAFASAKYSPQAIDRLTDPAVLAIGPALVLGLFASTFHMHDVYHVLNVFRHLDSSWLSREVTLGMVFAALGFLFAILQWWKLGSPILRRIVAGITALVGLMLVYSMAMIYFSLKAVPGWANWFTWVQFFGTTFILGPLLVAVAFVASRNVGHSRWEHANDSMTSRLIVGSPKDASGRKWYERVVAESAQVERKEIDGMVAWAIRFSVVFSSISAAAVLIALPFYLGSMAALGGAGLASAAVFASWLTVFRVFFLVAGIGMLGVFAYYLSSKLAADGGHVLAWVITWAFLLVLLAEFLGRTLFYEAMVRVGI